MLMGAAHNALRAFNARVSLTLPMRRRPQAATLVLRLGFDRWPVLQGSRPADLQQSSWRTGRMARHRQECIRLPYTAPEASHQAFFFKDRQVSYRAVGTRKGREPCPAGFRPEVP